MPVAAGAPERRAEHPAQQGPLPGRCLQPPSAAVMAAAAGRLPGMAGPCKGSASSANKISLGKYENSVCHVASTVAVKIDYR
jgi:hypothetical protein